MSNQKLDQLVDQVENYIECWKQFNNFVNLARAKKFSPEDDNQFLETKSVLVQELELILASVEVASPTREEIHALIADAPVAALRERDERRRLAQPGKPVAPDLYRLALHSRPVEGPPAGRGIQVRPSAPCSGRRRSSRCGSSASQLVSAANPS